jgi:UDP-N-acetylmuramoyl-L-alanyl-D-glutamate--2,6-diaminopimelate ligase
VSGVPLKRVADALAAHGLLSEVRGAIPASVASITDDSRQVTPGTLFIAVRGSQRDGHAYLASAEAAGAAAAVVEDPSGVTVPALVVRDGRLAAAVAAAAFYDEPAASLQLTAVTGTNGKTTTVGLLRHVLDAPDAPSASIGTLGVLVGSTGAPVPGGGGLTTPGPVELQRVLRALVERGVRRVAMEVSSHSLDQRRVEGVAFDAAVFTNLTRDHLDYHGTMEAYFAAKARLVEQVRPDGAVGATSADRAWDALDPAGRRLLRWSGAHPSDAWAERVRYTPTGSEWTLHLPGAAAAPVRLPLIGDFNVANALAAALAAHALGVPAGEIAGRLARAPQVPGRLELLHESPAVLRDYAHTPDALARALEAVRPFARGRLVVVFGCGGDRDRGKRPEMGAIAEARADEVIITSDNPRTEDPERILDDIEAGMTAGRHRRVEDRREAIRAAIAGAGPDDLVVLAGKGHETYQIRGTVSYPFDEAAIVAELAGSGAAR